MQNLNGGGRGKQYALGCPAKTSVFPDKAASSYTCRHLNLLLFPFGGYLSAGISPFWLHRAYVGVLCNLIVCVLLDPGD